MSSLPFTAQQCFYVAIIVFVIIGFQRGWRRELITLVFVLLAVVLVRPGNNLISSLFNRLLSAFGYIATGSTGSGSSAIPNNFLGMWGTLLVFALVIAIGYLVGNRVFPKPTNPADRILGVVPSVISGAFILYYLTSGDFFARDAQGQSFFSIVVQPPDPTRYVFVIFVIAILAVIAGLIMAARAKKPASPAAKK